MWMRGFMIMLMSFWTCSCVSPNLMVTSKPSGAEIYMKGEYQGTTPCKIKLNKEAYKSGAPVILSARLSDGRYAITSVDINTTGANTERQMAQAIGVPIVIGSLFIGASNTSKHHSYHRHHRPKKHNHRRDRKHNSSSDDLKVMAIIIGTAIVLYVILGTFEELSSKNQTKIPVHITNFSE